MAAVDEGIFVVAFGFFAADFQRVTDGRLRSTGICFFFVVVSVAAFRDVGIVFPRYQKIFGCVVDQAQFQMRVRGHDVASDRQIFDVRLERRYVRFFVAFLAVQRILVPVIDLIDIGAAFIIVERLRQSNRHGVRILGSDSNDRGRIGRERRCALGVRQFHIAGTSSSIGIEFFRIDNTTHGIIVETEDRDGNVSVGRPIRTFDDGWCHGRRFLCWCNRRFDGW